MKSAPFSYGKPMGLFGQPPALLAQSTFDQALSLHQSGQVAQALPLYLQVIALQPKHFNALNLAGAISLQLGDAHQSVDLLTRALKIERNHAGAHNNRGSAYQRLGDVDMAMLNFNKAIALDPKSEKAYNNRGNLLIRLNRLDEALRDFDQAIALSPTYFSPHNNRGTVLADMTRYSEARASFERAIELDPNSVDAHWNLGMCCLRLGDFETGWRESEWRLQRPHQVGLQEAYPAPLWTGQESLAGKTILLCHEQGLGDTIQFCRYARLVAELGARVLLLVQPGLRSLLRDLPGVELFVQGDSLPAYDFYCPLLSLPLVFKTDLSHIPLPPDVIHPTADQVAQWAARLGEKRKPRVGIVWSGNADHVDDYKRSIPLKDFVSLLSDDIQWVSLHKDAREADQATLKAHPEIAHFGAEQQDFTDAAALCQLMDLVVSVDTSLAHLAATMGRPTWVVLARNPDWRWLLDRRDNPWYPSATLYRQDQLGDWTVPIQSIRADLSRSFQS
ncbi:MAG: tetratricopeptide repeat protein [Burkholderiales bacterium]|nr:tetratricopeptide repeat protein [Burkholderiales bacterium]